MGKLHESLPTSPLPASVILISVVSIYRLLRLCLEAPIRPRVSARARRENSRLAVAYVAVLLVATLCVVFLIKTLVNTYTKPLDDPMSNNRTGNLERAFCRWGSQNHAPLRSTQREATPTRRHV